MAGQWYRGTKPWTYWIDTLVDMGRHTVTKGPKSTIQRLRNAKMWKIGVLKGVDEFGNHYYEDTKYTINGRHRWVEYSAKDYHASQIPSEWHSWLHYIEDTTPTENPPQPVLFKLRHEPTTLSQLGFKPNYVPPGHFGRRDPVDFRQAYKAQSWSETEKEKTEKEKEKYRDKEEKGKEIA
eukprot:TRINITY_DN11965_c0_g1_i2.p1 TRINITY_DN11965_c0_g1~~TRINITY_DN11965_c0_g1_i2.p1  ORF type:complete len:180 (-),score=15.85 TRINITY_DN11965_c0_g1_i2:146-685(-)